MTASEQGDAHPIAAPATAEETALVEALRRGDDGAFAGSGGPGGGHPKKAITFKSVTVGPVQSSSP